jgi:glycosyltransferase involved in cell wall biosynthesis
MRIECIPYGIHFPAALSRPARGTDAPLRVVYVGRVIETQKRISRLAALMRLLDARRVNVAFTIIGSGPDEATLKAAAADCRHVPITLLGNVPNHEVSALLSAQDVYVLLSDFEGLPLSLLEAMGNGVVPVVSDLPGGMQQVVSPDCGVRVPVGDVEAAATAITALATDRERLERLSATAVPKVRQGYSAEGMAARYLRVIEEGCAGKPAPSWPQTVKVPSPLVLNPWLYQGWPRKVRRGLKAILSKA